MMKKLKPESLENVHTHTHTGQFKKTKSESAITLIALVITTIFSYDENVKSSNNKGFLLKTI